MRLSFERSSFSCQSICCWADFNSTERKRTHGLNHHDQNMAANTTHTHTLQQFTAHSNTLAHATLLAKTINPRILCALPQLPSWRLAAPPSGSAAPRVYCRTICITWTQACSFFIVEIVVFFCFLFLKFRFSGKMADWLTDQFGQSTIN